MIKGNQVIIKYILNIYLSALHIIQCSEDLCPAEAYVWEMPLEFKTI